MIARVKDVKFPTWTVPVGLFLFALVSFGLLIPQLGFYWDDWSKILVSRIWGLQGYWSYYAEDRPLSAWTHILLTPVLGNTPFAWHVFVLLLRWLSACGMWWCLRLLWPKAQREAAFAAFLFLVYPVFKQQAIAVTFHQQWMQYVLFFISIGAMIWAYRCAHRFYPWTVIALVALLLQLSITEYFVGVELVRPLVIWVMLTASVLSLRRRLLTAFKIYLPYLLVLVVYVVWRLFFIQLSSDDPYRANTLYAFFESPLTALIDLAKVVVVDSFYVLVASWADALNVGLSNYIPRFVFLVWGIGLVCALLVFAYLFKLDDTPAVDDGENTISWLYQAMVIGLLATLFGCIPAWITGRRVIEDFHANRYALPAMFGGSLLSVALLEWFCRRKLQKTIALAALIGLAAILHLRVADEYRQIWKNQLDFYWQLYWRAPYIEPQTAIFSDDELFPNQGRFSTSAAINLLYPQPERAPQLLAYWHFGLRPKLTYAAKNPFDIPLYTQFRSLVFESTTSNALVVHFDPQRADCLWLLDPTRDMDDPDISSLTRELLQLSKLERIRDQPVSTQYPPPDLFGNRSEQDWCYYYQKAELARQFGQWGQIAELADHVRSQGYCPDDGRYKPPHEWLPFIEGYAHVGRWEDAEELTLTSAYVEVLKYAPRFCTHWNRLLQDTSASTARQEATQRVFSELQCAP